MSDYIPMHNNMTAGKVRAALANLPDTAPVSVVYCIGTPDTNQVIICLPIDVINVEDNAAEFFGINSEAYPYQG
jgi:hypothetical protein